MNLKVDPASVRELEQSIAEYQRAVKKDAFEALKYGAYHASRSLIARTKKAKSGPKIASATKKDMEELSGLIQPWSNFKGDAEAWKRYVSSLAGKAWVARSDRRKDKGFRRKRFWLKAEYSKETVKTITAFYFAGLAKASWRWCAERSKRGSGGSGRFADTLETNCSVRADRPSMTIVISNRLPYIVKALTSASAVEDALRAAAKQMQKFAKDAIEKQAQKRGLTKTA